MDEERLVKAILHYQQNLERYIDRKDEAKMLHCIEKLHRLPITVAHLERTGVGRVVNSIRKMKGIRSAPKDAAKELVDRWKQMVTDEEECNDSDEEEEEEEEESREQDDESNEDEDDDEEEEELSDEDRLQIYDGGVEEEETRNIGVRHSSHREDTSPGRGASQEWDEYCDRRRQEPRETRVVQHRAHREETPAENGDSMEVRSPETRETVEAPPEKPTDIIAEPEESSQQRKSHKKSSKSSKHEHKEEKPREKRRSRSREKDLQRSTGKHRESRPKDSHKSSHEKDEKIENKSKDKENKCSPKKSSKLETPTKRRSAEEISNSPKKSKMSATVTSLDDGIDCESGASFAEALGMMGSFDQAKAPPINAKKERKDKEKPKKEEEKRRRDHKRHKEKHRKDKHREREKSKNDAVPAALKTPPPSQSKLEENMNTSVISSLLPAMSTNYKPMAYVEQAKRAAMSLAGDDEALTRLMYSKTQRTKVYSGVKTFYGKVPSLFDSCIRVLQDNVESLGYTGGVPYSILKPVLERLNPEQLYTLEFYNSNLMEESDVLWQLHCQRDFKHQQREEMETWREMYFRCVQERDAKLKALTANIKLAQDKSVPVRQTKLAYVDSFIKPPRNVAKKQAKNGVGPLMKPSAKLSQLALAGGADKLAVPNPGAHRVNLSGAGTGSGSGSWGNPSSSTNAAKPRKAPLMAKTLQLMKGRYRR